MMTPKNDLERFKEEELLALVRETVAQLNILGDQLEHYAESRLPQEGETDAGTIAEGG